ncbi:hypothetical protein B0H66DRAFT_249757 [Apodospora peruviana]|uniref:Uncharacterized protein n=1 Tax=Apodospora peruviana TaxID=516989 RepID=A0AAE0I551_9PEZI|nr:hypothetical protein B0H66DRAFT_249757 [Apodospora peruviana]
MIYRASKNMALSITTTSFTSSPIATAPIHAFTTPFPQPASCDISALLTTTVKTYTDYGTTTSRTFLLPDASDPRYTACLDPAGGQFTFSPAVCPQGWPALWLGMTTSTLSGAATTTAHVSTAYCCAPDYSMPNGPPEDGPSPRCEQAFISTTSSSGDMIPSVWTLSVAKVPAWHISWQPTDIPTLSPQPPEIEGYSITQWVPGSDPQREHQDNWGGGINRSLFLFLVAGIPVILVVAMGACLTGCCVRRRQRNEGKAGNPNGLGATRATS